MMRLVPSVILMTLATSAVSVDAFARITNFAETVTRRNGSFSRATQYAVNGPWGAPRAGIQRGTASNQFENDIRFDSSKRWPQNTRFVWRWPNTVPNSQFNNAVKAFNYVGAGWLNRENRYYRGIFPKEVGRIPRRAVVDASVTNNRVTGNWNYSLNMMTRGRTNDGRTLRLTSEIHIFEHYTGSIPATNRIGTLRNIQGSNYIMRKIRNAEFHPDNGGTGRGRGNPYYQAYRVKKRRSGNIPAGEVIRWFVNNNDSTIPIANLESDQELAFVRLGFEIRKGAGWAQINRFNLNNF